jgi:hypothetical protein
MRSYEEYRQILDLWERGYPKKRIAIMTGIPRRTVIDCIQKFESLEGLEKHIESTPASILLDTLKTANVLENAQLFESYAYLLGIYLGDGCISYVRKTPRLRITLGTLYPNIIAQCMHTIQAILPDNKVNTVKRRENAVEVVCFQI